LLGEALAGEPPAALQRLAREDQRQAEEGLVALTSNGKRYYKVVEELTEGDMGARIAADRLREAWLKERQDGWLDYRGPQRGRPPVVEFSQSRGCRLSLNVSASRVLMLMCGCISMSLSSGFAAILSHLLLQANRRD
jgi:hypothetical protein